MALWINFQLAIKGRRAPLSESNYVVQIYIFINNYYALYLMYCTLNTLAFTISSRGYRL
jgi:predicted nucleic acid-binding Zn finger protein